MLRERRLAETDRDLELAHRTLLAHELAQNRQAVRIGELLQEIRGSACFRAQNFYIHVY